MKLPLSVIQIVLGVVFLSMIVDPCKAQSRAVLVHPGKPSDRRILQVLRQSNSDALKVRGQTVSLADFLAQVGTTFEISLHIDRAAIQKDGIDLSTNITVVPDSLPLESLLAWTLGSHELVCFVHGDNLIVTTAHDGLSVAKYGITVIHDISDCISAAPGIGMLGWPDLRADVLVEAISRTVEPEGWTVGGGDASLTPITLRGRTLLSVRATPIVHDRVEKLLDQIRAAVPGLIQKDPPKQNGTQGDANDATWQTINREIDVPRWDKQSLPKVLGELHKVISFPYVFDHERLDQTIEQGFYEVSCPAEKTSIRALLDRWLPNFGADWHIQHGVVFIGPKSVIEEAKHQGDSLILKVYPIGDLYRQRPGNQKDIDFDELSLLIETTLGLEPWLKKICPLHHAEALVMNLTVKEHGVAESLLAKLRAYLAENEAKTANVPSANQQDIVTVVIGFTDENAAKQFVEAIPKVVAPEKWAVHGGKGELHAIGRKVLVKQESGLQEEVQQIRSKLQQIQGGD